MDKDQNVHIGHTGVFKGEEPFLNRSGRDCPPLVGVIRANGGLPDSNPPPAPCREFPSRPAGQPPLRASEVAPGDRTEFVS